VSEVLNTAFYFPYGLRGITEADATASLAQDLMCYDKVWILSSHMRAAGTVFAAMGRHALQLALETNAIGFVRDRCIYAWPKRPGYNGLTPILVISALPGGNAERGTALWPTGVLASGALAEFSLPTPEHNWFADAIRRATVEVGFTEKNKRDEQTGKGIDVLTQEDLLRWREVLTRGARLSLTLNDIDRLADSVVDPRRSPLAAKELGLFEATAASGEELLRHREPIAPKQLDLLNLVITDRLMHVQQTVSSTGTLHADPLLEAILRCQLHHTRDAAGAEMEELLDAEEIRLPTADDPASFPFEELVLERDTDSARNFRSLVARRDSRPDAKLIQEYLRQMRAPLRTKFVVRVARFLFGKSTALAGGPVALAGKAIDTLAIESALKALDATYYVDYHLRRLANRSQPPASFTG
jgi:hypothetical protein